MMGSAAIQGTAYQLVLYRTVLGQTLNTLSRALREAAPASLRITNGHLNLVPPFPSPRSGGALMLFSSGISVVVASASAGQRPNLGPLQTLLEVQ